MDNRKGLSFPLEKPRPDFEELSACLSGRRPSGRVHFVEMLVDEEIKAYLIEHLFHERNQPPVVTFGGGKEGPAPGGEENLEAAGRYYEQLIRFYYRMGYSVIADYEFLVNFQAFNKAGRVGRDPDTSELAREARHWAEEGHGMIRCQADFELFPWAEVERLADAYPEHIERLTRLLPDGMKIAVVGSVLEQVMEWLAGYEVVFYGLYDQPELIAAVFEKVGGIVERLYRNVVAMPGVGVIWHGDDVGFKQGTLLSVEALRKLVFPWFRKYAAIAHDHGKPCWFHGCGNRGAIMEDLIEDIRFDALHSFEDPSYPVEACRRAYGDRIALLGGVDVDKLARLSEPELRRYVRRILEACQPGGRFALGSGNSICNYVPVRNYLVMLEEGLKYG